MIPELLVTDTHPIIHFFCSNQNKLGTNALAAFNRAMSGRSTSIYVPAPVLWELSMLVENQDIVLSKPFSDWVDELFQYPAIIPAAFDFETVKLVHGLNYHNDPFDRAIVATALQIGVPLISNDGKMHEHKPCQLYWD